jgi:hypothetical protein
VTTRLQELLPVIVPKAIEWAHARSGEILESGTPLTATELQMARAVGVANPENIRVLMVDSLPLPEDPLLREVAVQTGLLGDDMVGLTLGYGIYLCGDYRIERLIRHECRHVYQFEQAGSIDAFLPVYLQQIAAFGYDHAPYEIDATKHEVIDANLIG